MEDEIRARCGFRAKTVAASWSRLRFRRASWLVSPPPTAATRALAKAPAAGRTRTAKRHGRSRRCSMQNACLGRHGKVKRWRIRFGRTGPAGVLPGNQRCGVSVASRAEGVIRPSPAIGSSTQPDRSAGMAKRAEALAGACSNSLRRPGQFPALGLTTGSLGRREGIIPKADTR